MFEAVRSAIEKLHELPSMSSTRKLLFNRPHWRFTTAQPYAQLQSCGTRRP